MAFLCPKSGFGTLLLTACKAGTIFHAMTKKDVSKLDKFRRNEVKKSNLKNLRGGTGTNADSNDWIVVVDIIDS